jgi:hypothetical protein
MKGETTLLFTPIPLLPPGESGVRTMQDAYGPQLPYADLKSAIIMVPTQAGYRQPIASRSGFAASTVNEHLPIPRIGPEPLTLKWDQDASSIGVPSQYASRTRRVANRVARCVLVTVIWGHYKRPRFVGKVELYSKEGRE